MGNKLPSLILTYLVFIFAIPMPPSIGIAQSAGDFTWFAPAGGTSAGAVLFLKNIDDTSSVNVSTITNDADINLSGSSAADGSDIGSYTTQTVNFGSGDTSSTTRDVAVTDDAPAIVFNEINADPGDDANGDGAVDSDTDEFIEWVNNSKQDIDISGWIYEDGATNPSSYTFPEGTVIGAGNAIVLFDNSGGVQPVGNFGAAYVFTDAEIGLNQSPETLTLSDAKGNIIATATYTNNASGESNNLDPDGTGTSYVNHSAIAGSGGALSSPGTQVDGTPWGNGTFAIGLRGSEGYRFISIPAQGTTFEDLFSNLWTQGIAGSDANNPSDAANIFSWQESGGGMFSTIANMNDNLTAGQGYIIYVFEDDDYRAPGMQGGFPKTINTSEGENSSPVSVAVSSNDAGGAEGIDGNEGFNLLGNPFGTDISVAAVIDALEAAAPSATVNANLYIWDHDANGGNGEYVDLTDGDQLAPFQAFFMRYTTDGVSENASFDRNNLTTNQGKEFYSRPPEQTLQESTVNFELYMGDGNKFDSYEVEFKENGTIGEDRYDAYKLFSLNANSINFFSMVGENVQLAKNVLPPFESIEEGEELRIPFGYNVPKSRNYIFSWNLPDQLPENMELYLVDNELDREVNIKDQEEYEVSLGQIGQNGDPQANTQNVSSPALSKANVSESTDRFELKIVRTEQIKKEPEPMQKPVVLSPNYPNPFNNQTRMDLDLEKNMHVRITVWNIVGQKVDTITDEMMDAGQDHPLIWNVPANMPSGIYICKVEAGGTVITRKMTLVK